MRNTWKDEEIKLIYDNYENMTDKELSFIISEHSESSIATKRKRLGLHRANRKYTYNDVVQTCNERGYILLSTDFTSCANNVDFICKRHQQYGVQHVTYGHMLEGKGCYWCGRERTDQARKDLVSLDQKISICKENGLEYVGCNYKDNLLNIEFYCLRHKDIGIQTMRYQNMKRGIYGCRYCSKEKGISKSKGEIETANVLDSYGIRYVEQKIFNNCQDKTYLPFDFYLIDYNILIEFDGEQHYFVVRFNGMSQQDAENNFIEIQKHDYIKTQYCLDNNIPLIRIPYTERGNVEFYLQKQLPLIFSVAS